MSDWPSATFSGNIKQVSSYGKMKILSIPKVYKDCFFRMLSGLECMR